MKDLQSGSALCIGFLLGCCSGVVSAKVGQLRLAGRGLPQRVRMAHDKAHEPSDIALDSFRMLRCLLRAPLMFCLIFGRTGIGC